MCVGNGSGVTWAEAPWPWKLVSLTGGADAVLWSVVYVGQDGGGAAVPRLGTDDCNARTILKYCSIPCHPNYYFFHPLLGIAESGIHVRFSLLGLSALVTSWH